MGTSIQGRPPHAPVRKERPAPVIENVKPVAVSDIFSHHRRPSARVVTDGLKFRLVAQDGRHYFREVRFKAESLSREERAAVAGFFEDKCLESMTAEQLNCALGNVSCIGVLQELVRDLQFVFCD